MFAWASECRAFSLLFPFLLFLLLLSFLVLIHCKIHSIRFVSAGSDDILLKHCFLQCVYSLLQSLIH